MNAIIQLEWDPLIGWQTIAVLAAFSVVITLVGLARSPLGSTPRAVALLALVLALLNPSFVSERRTPLTDIGVVVVDQSPSMGLGERTASADAALAALQAQVDARHDLELRVVTAGAGGGIVDRTQLFEALERAFADVPMERRAGAVLITDGQVHDLPTLPADLDDSIDPLGYGPVHALIAGDQIINDRRVEIVRVPAFGLIGQTVPVTVTAHDSRLQQGATIPMTVSRDGQQDILLSVPTGEPVTFDLPVDNRGDNAFEFALAARPGELTLANNRAAIVVSGVFERLRVLLVSGEPHPGQRTWRRLLKADPSVDLVHFTILRPPEKMDSTPISELSLIAFPVRELFELRLDDFDLVIFDRYRRRGVLPSHYLGNIANYVREGGALLVASGPSFASGLSIYHSALGEILPGEPTGTISETGFLPQVTALGDRHPVTAALPRPIIGPNGEGWGRWFRQIDARVVSAEPLMVGHAEQPLLLLDRVGQGRVAQLMSDHIWLWSRGFEGGGPQAELLRRLAHWLMKEPELEEVRLSATVEGGMLRITRRGLIADDRPVQLTRPDGTVEEIDLPITEGGATAETLIPVTGPGLHKVAVLPRGAEPGLSGVATVGALNPPEWRDAAATAAVLAPIADATGGGILRLAEVTTPDLRRVAPDRSQFGRQWVGLRANGRYVVAGVDRLPLLPVLLLLVLVIGGIGLGWWRESRA